MDYVYTEKEKLMLIKAFELVAREEYKMVRGMVDPDCTKSESFIDGEWEDWIQNEFHNFATNSTEYLSEETISKLAYYISNVIWDWNDDGAVESFYRHYEITPFDLVKWIVRSVVIYDDEGFESDDIEEIQRVCEEVFDSEEIKFSKKLIRSEFIRANKLSQQ